MAGGRGGRSRLPILHVGPIDNRRWVVSVDDDPTPISEHESRVEAEAAARAHAQSFGYPQIVVHGLDRDDELILVGDPDPRPPYPGAARGDAAG
jgi:nucleotide-binding universal stress UspA family protein